MAAPRKSGEAKPAAQCIKIDSIARPTPSRLRLDSLDAVRVEMARVYRDCRSGKLDTAEGSKLNYQLQGIGKMLEATIVERRLLALENSIGAGEFADSASVQDVDYVEVRPS
jgi:hypothetical protein